MMDKRKYELRADQANTVTQTDNNNLDHPGSTRSPRIQTQYFYSPKHLF